MTNQLWYYRSELANQFRAEGRAEGKAEGKAEAVLVVLENRGIHVPSATRDQIMSCTDTATLEGWLDRALEATSIEDLFV